MAAEENILNLLQPPSFSSIPTPTSASASASVWSAVANFWNGGSGGGGGNSGLWDQHVEMTGSDTDSSSTPTSNRNPNPNPNPHRYVRVKLVSHTFNPRWSWLDACTAGWWDSAGGSSSSGSTPMWEAGLEWELLPPSNLNMIRTLVQMLHGASAEEAAGAGAGTETKGHAQTRMHGIPTTSGVGSTSNSTSASTSGNRSASINTSNSRTSDNTSQSDPVGLDRSSTAFKRLPAHLKPETAAELIQRTLFDREGKRQQKKGK